MAAANTPAGSSRFWKTVLCFALANIALWVGYHYHIQDQHRVLRVDASTPTDDSIVGTRPVFTWRFNLDVVPNPGAIPDSAPSPVLVTPALAGKFIWTDNRTLMFSPSADLPKATRFKFEVRPGTLISATGFTLAAPYVTTIRTTPLSLTEIRQTGSEENGQYTIAITFDDNVLPSEALAHLQVHRTDHSSVKTDILGDPQASHTIRIRTEPIQDRPSDGETTKLIVRVLPGLAGTGGPLGILDTETRELVLDQRFVLSRVDARTPAQGQPAIDLEFNQQVALEEIKDVITIEPSIPFQVIGHYSGVSLRGDFEPGRRYAVKLSAPPPGAKLAARVHPDTRGVCIPDRDAGVWFDHSEGYLGSRGNRTVLGHAVNISKIDVTVSRLYENTLSTWSVKGGAHNATDFAKPIATKQIALNADKNKVVDIMLSLSELLPSEDTRDGTYYVALRSMNKSEDDGNSGRSSYRQVRSIQEYESDEPAQTASCLVTLSDIGMSVKQSRDKVFVWTTSLASAKPLAGIHVSLLSNKGQQLGEAISNADGMAFISNISPASGEYPAVMLAENPAGASGSEKGSGLTWLDLKKGQLAGNEDEIGGRPYFREGFEAFVFTDRGVYRPGDTLYLNAIVRGVDGRAPQPFPIRWVLNRPDNHEWLTQTAMPDSDGSLRWTVALPTSLPTGMWTARLGFPHDNTNREFGSVEFQIEEFIPDRLKVAVQVTGHDLDQDQRLSVNGPLSVRVSGDYLFGQPAAKCPANLTARFEPAPFTSAKWPLWTFGDSAKVIELRAGQPSIAGETRPTRKHAAKRHADETLSELVLDDAGHSEWEITPPADNDNDDHDTFRGPWRMTLCGSVREAGGRAVSTTRQVMIDSLPYYVGIRPRIAGSIKPGIAATFDLALVSPDGTLKTTDSTIEVALFEETWNSSYTFHDGHYEYESSRRLELASKKAPEQISLKSGKGECCITAPQSGSFVLQVRDLNTHTQSSFAFYANSGEWWNASINLENPEKIDLTVVPDTNSLADISPKGTREFRVGERVQALVRSPFAGQLLITVETDVVVWHKVVTMEKSCTSVPVEISAQMFPNAYISATVIRGIDPNATWRPHRAFGRALLSIDRREHLLTTEIESPAEIQPNGTLEVAATLRDSTGKPESNAAVTLIAVDEGILGLTHFSTPDPLAAFTAKRALSVKSSDLFSQLMPEVARPSAVSATGGDGGDDLDADRYHSAVSARRVSPVALVSAPLRTDSQGHVQTRFTIPGFTGQLRIMAVSHFAQKFGSAAKSILVRSPVMVQSSWPRFAAPEDHFTVTVTVFNNTDRSGDAQITLELPETGNELNALQVRGGSEHSLTLPSTLIDARGQVTLQIPVSAGAFTGIGRARIIARLNGNEFVDTVELPVRPASSTITRGNCVSVSAGKSARFSVPSDMLHGTNKLQIHVTPWPELELPRGLDYLNHYPYGCAEQTISTCFPLVYMHDIEERLMPGAMSKDAIADKIQTGINRLLSMETHEGGVAMWPGSHDTWPWASLYAAHFILEAKIAGFTTPEDFRNRLLAYARKTLNKNAANPDDFECQAYACFVLALAGNPNRSAMERLLEVSRDPSRAAALAPGSLSASFHALLAAAWLHAGRTDVALAMLPKNIIDARAISTERKLDGNVGSDVRDRAILLNTLESVQPDNPKVTVLALELAAAGRNGRWQSTQDTAFAVMALGRYLHLRNTPAKYDSVALWGDGKLLATATNGQPLLWKPARDCPHEFELRVTGAPSAEAWADWLQTGVPLKPANDADSGIEVRRRYLDKEGKPLASNTVRSGLPVRIELTLKVPDAMKNVAIEDLLPAGLEIENPRLDTTAVEAKDDNATLDQTRKMPAIESIQYMDIRDDRMMLAVDLAAGYSRHVYLARAVTPGVYALPQVHAECMYAIGTCSLSGADESFTVLPAVTETGHKK